MTRLAPARQDEEGFREFVTERGGRLFQVAYFIAGDYHDAQDLLQTSLAKLYVAWPRIERAQAADAYARKVLLRTYLSQRRLKRSTELPVDVHDLAGRLIDPGGDHDLQLSLAAALRQLPPRNRAVVVLRYLEGHDTATIADCLNTTPSAVKSLNSRSLRLLRTLLGESREALFSPQNQ